MRRELSRMGFEYLSKKPQRALSCSSAKWWHSKKICSVLTRERTLSRQQICSYLNLELPTFQYWEKYMLHVSSHVQCTSVLWSSHVHSYTKEWTQYQWLYLRTMCRPSSLWYDVTAVWAKTMCYKYLGQYVLYIAAFFFLLCLLVSNNPQF